MKRLWIFWWIALAFSAALVLAGSAIVGGWDALGVALIVLGGLGVVGSATYASVRL